jgi:hypothetical protein
MKTKLQQIILGLTIFGALFAEVTVCGAALESSAQELNASIQAQPSASKLPRGCAEFCVNGQMAGNCRLVWRHTHEQKAA